MKTIQLDIVSDVVCPWCAIGYAHLSKAIDSLSDQLEVNINWHPFELNPHMAPEGQEINEHLMEKYGSTADQLQENKNRIRDIGAQAGIELNFDARSRIYNTLDCHKLLTWAEEKGKQTDLKLALFEAYFGNGQNVSERAILKSVVESVGLSSVEAEIVLNDEHYLAKVRDEQAKYRSMGINAVPAVIVNNQFLINGGQPTEVFKQALLEVANQAVNSESPES